MKRFKTRKKHRNKSILIVVLVFVFIILFIFISTRNLNNSYGSFINLLLEEQGIVKREKSSFFSYFLTNLDILINNYYFKDDNSHEEIVSSIVYNTSEPLVYLYNTHDNELYNDNKFGVYNVLNLFEKELAKYNIDSVIENKRVSSYLDKENKSYSDSYKISRRFLDDVIGLYPDLNYFIDVHRDSVDGNITTVNIDNKNYARIMFVLGLENDKHKENEILVNELNSYLNENYSGLSRGIYKKKGSGVNGVYNQDFHMNTILIEVGGIDNNKEEVINSVEVVVKALNYVINENK